MNKEMLKIAETIKAAGGRMYLVFEEAFDQVESLVGCTSEEFTLV